MPRKIPLLVWPAAPLACFTYLYGLSATGLMGVDEPRYAAIAREMAWSGDWITPRLWGSPWFEKPVLLYWVQGLAYRLGLGPELAARLPVVLCAIAFLAFFWWILNREFGCLSACIATLLLATTGGYLGYSQVGHMDLLLTASFGAAMLLALPWVQKGDGKYLPAASALLGVAVLAKSGVALVLMLPLFWWGRRRLKDLLHPRVVLPFLAVALPWYAACYSRNGMAFVRELFLKQQLQRMTSDAVQHVQPAWYYLPVLLALLLPWTPLAGLLGRRSLYIDARRTFLLALIVWGAFFFSISRNKLPGYVLPLLPFLAALMALGIVEARNPRPLLAACALLLTGFLIAARMLPAAVASGITHASWPRFEPSWAAPIAVAAIAWLLDRQGRRLAAVFAISTGACLGMLYLKMHAAPDLDRTASARPLWQQVSSHADQTCVELVNRNWLYSLNYYSVTPLPECTAPMRRFRIRQKPGDRAYVWDSSSQRAVDPSASGIVLSHFR